MPISPLLLAFLVATAAALGTSLSMAAPAPGKWLSKDPQTHTGTWQSDKGSIYVGGYFGDEWHGQGKLTYFNGDVTEGIWEHDQLVGQMKHVFKDGPTYEGGVADTNPTSCRQTYPNGQLYEGICIRGVPWGKGTMNYADGDVFVGEFVDNGKYMKGRMAYRNGDIYDGEMNKGRREGYGVITYAAVGYRKYEGYWKANRYHGMGAVTTWSGGVTAGRFENGDLMESTNDSGPSFGQLLTAVAGGVVIASTGGVQAADKVRLGSSFASDVLGGGSGTATASTVADLKQRQAAAEAKNRVGAPPTTAAPASSGCLSYGQVGNRDTTPFECLKGKQSAFGWGDTQSAACEGAKGSYRGEFSYGKNPSGCYCKANATVNTVVQPYVCWIAFE